MTHVVPYDWTARHSLRGRAEASLTAYVTLVPIISLALVALVRTSRRVLNVIVRRTGICIDFVDHHYKDREY